MGPAPWLTPTHPLKPNSSMEAYDAACESCLQVKHLIASLFGPASGEGADTLCSSAHEVRRVGTSSINSTGWSLRVQDAQPCPQALRGRYDPAPGWFAHLCGGLMVPPAQSALCGLSSLTPSPPSHRCLGFGPRKGLISSLCRPSSACISSPDYCSSVLGGEEGRPVRTHCAPCPVRPPLWALNLGRL